LDYIRCYVSLQIAQSSLTLRKAAERQEP
jgi:hypothetical protein